MASKKLTINTLMVSMPEQETTEITLEGELFTKTAVCVKHKLALEEAISFVKDITATCIDEERAEYMPELIDFATRLYVVLHYASIDLTKNVKKAYNILYNTTLYDQIRAHVDAEQLSYFVGMAEKRIRYQREVMASSAAKQVMELLKNVEAMISGNEALMESVNTEDFKSAVMHLAESGLMGSSNDMNPQGFESGVLYEDQPQSSAALSSETEVTQSDASAEQDNVIYMKKK